MVIGVIVLAIIAINPPVLLDTLVEVTIKNQVLPMFHPQGAVTVMLAINPGTLINTATLEDTNLNVT